MKRILGQMLKGWHPACGWCLRRPASLTADESSLRATRIQLIKANGKHLEPVTIPVSTLN